MFFTYVARLWCCFFFSSRRRHTRWPRDWSSDVCSSDLLKSRSRTNTRSWSRSLRIRARSSSRSSRGSGKVQPHLRQESPPYAGDRSPYAEVSERTIRSAARSRARIVGVRIEQLLAADLVIGNGSLAFRRNEPVDEGLAKLLFYVRMLFRIY